MHDSNNTWKQEYDPILQQYYYVNLLDNSISFDSPCEVINHKRVLLVLILVLANHSLCHLKDLQVIPVKRFQNNVNLP